MAFLEIQFPPDIGAGASGGPGYNTTLVTVNSGHESANINWSEARCQWDVAHGLKTQAQLDTLITFFRVAKGRGHRWRFKDWLDYLVTVTNGILAAGIGTGLPACQLVKRYSNAGGTEDRVIAKPVAGTVAIYRNAVLQAAGVGAGNYALDTTTGIATFVADASSNASVITPGAQTQVTLASNLGLVGGKLLHLSGFTGTHAALVNGLAHPIAGIAGGGPYVFTLNTDTNGKTITLGAGVGSKFAQASDALTWSGEFDVPARFDIDRMSPQLDDQGIYSWGQIPVVEVRV